MAERAARLAKDVLAVEARILDGEQVERDVIDDFVRRALELKRAVENDTDGDEKRAADASATRDEINAALRTVQRLLSLLE